MQYALMDALMKDASDADAFVDAARTHGLGMWKVDCRSVQAERAMWLCSMTSNRSYSSSLRQ